MREPIDIVREITEGEIGIEGDNWNQESSTSFVSLVFCCRFEGEPIWVNR